MSDGSQHSGPGGQAPFQVDPLLGQTIGNYQVTQKLGEGGMGSVYLAEQIELLRRRVALKLIKLGMDTREVIARFEAERQALAMMSHPNIARVYDAGVTEHGRPYFVMEYVPGVSITQYCDTHRLRLEERLELFIQVCDAVKHAHQRGILHRDLKPANLMLEPSPGPVDRVALIDFGFASLEGEAGLTQQGTVVGSLIYLSPERLSGEPADERSDVYAMGVIFFELLTGRPPFLPENDDDLSLITQHLEAPVPLLAELGVEPLAARILQPIVARALAKVPDDRYLSARHMSLDLEEAARLVPSSERRPRGTLQEY